MMKNLITIFFLTFAGALLAQPVRTTITDDGTNVTIQTPVNIKVVPICDFHWSFTDGNLQMWIAGRNELIPGGRLGNFTVNGATTQASKLAALGAISDKCSTGGGGLDSLYYGNTLLSSGDTIPSNAGGDPTMGGDLSGLASNAQINSGAVEYANLAQAAKDSLKINITTGTLPAATANRTVQMGGFDLNFTGADDITLQSNGNTYLNATGDVFLGNGSGSNLPTTNSDHLGMDVGIGGTGEFILSQKAAKRSLSGSSDPTNGNTVAWYVGQLHTNTTSGDIFVATTVSSNPDLSGTGSTWIKVSDTGGGVTTGDKGDIDVVNVANDWRIDTGAVTWVDLAQAVKDSINASGTTNGNIFSETQTAHGFSPATPIARAGNAWVEADTINFAEGIVVDSSGANTFTWASDGQVTITAHGLTVDSVYYTSATGGAAVKYSGIASIAQPLFQVASTNTLIVNIGQPVRQYNLPALIASFDANFKGIATTSTNPGTPSQPEWWIGSNTGTYTNFGGVVVTAAFSILAYNGTSWSVHNADVLANLGPYTGYYADTASVNSAAEIQALLNANDVVILPAKTIYLTSGLTLAAGKTLKGASRGKTVLRFSGSGYSFITVAGDNVTIKDITISGTASYDITSTSQVNSYANIEAKNGIGTQIGIYVNLYKNVTLENVRVKKCTGSGIKIENTASGYIGAINGTNIVVDSNYVGLDFVTNGEYNLYSNVHANSNVIGAFVGGGNNYFSNCSFTANRVGFVIADGVNDSHGSASNCAFNHNEYVGIYGHDYEYGFWFTGCEIFTTNSIYMDTGIGFQFTGGYCGGTVSVNNGGLYYFGTMMFGNGITPTSSGTANLQMKNNYRRDGTTVGVNN